MTNNMKVEAAWIMSAMNILKDLGYDRRICVVEEISFINLADL